MCASFVFCDVYCNIHLTLIISRTFSSMGLSRCSMMKSCHGKAEFSNRANTTCPSQKRNNTKQNTAVENMNNRSRTYSSCRGVAVYANNAGSGLLHRGGPSEETGQR